MKKLVICIMAVLMAAGLSGCCLVHDWEEATCEKPKTCAKCGETEGEALGHVWEEATCTKAKACSVCGAEQGSPLGHSWKAATCTEAAAGLSGRRGQPVLSAELREKRPWGISGRRLTVRGRRPADAAE